LVKIFKKEEQKESGEEAYEKQKEKEKEATLYWRKMLNFQRSMINVQVIRTVGNGH
jgi:hypothetical protein